MPRVVRTCKTYFEENKVLLEWNTQEADILSKKVSSLLHSNPLNTFYIFQNSVFTVFRVALKELPPKNESRLEKVSLFL